MYDVFISYKSEERGEAEYIRNYFQASGLTCWMDQQQIRVGQDYEKNIDEVMPECRALVLLLSYASQNSKEVKIEYELARKNGLPVFPVKIEDCKLTDYYAGEMKHTQIATNYWQSEKKKLTELNSIRDQIYEAKGEEPKTAEDLLNMRIEYYQHNLQEIYSRMEAEWDEVVLEGLGRYGFMTPEPHHMEAVIIDAVQEYQHYVRLYLTDITNNIKGIIDTVSEVDYYIDFSYFIAQYDLISKIWIPYQQFERIACERLNLFDDEMEIAFALRIYKDYLLALQSEAVEHPVVQLARRLYETDTVSYEKWMSGLLKEIRPSFIHEGHVSIFIHPRYVGNDYYNIGSSTDIDESRSVVFPEELIPPIWTDFLRKFTCDVFLEELEKKNGGAAEITTFCIENAFFTNDKREYTSFNWLYLYLIFRFIEAGHPRYVKILMRHLLGGKVDWFDFMMNVRDEIVVLYQFYECCMKENGYDAENLISLCLGE